MKRSHKKFTLVEILVTISIILVLAGMIMAGVNVVIGKAEKLKAKQGAVNLANAVREYKSVYGTLPITRDRSGENDTYRLNDTEYDKLVQILTNVNGDWVGCEARNYLDNKDKNDRRNAKKKSFLSPNDRYEELGYVDPWGERYVIIMDDNYDGIIVLEDEEGKDKDYRTDVVVYSKGLNGEDNGGLSYGENAEARTSESGEEYDDILGW